MAKGRRDPDTPDLFGDDLGLPRPPQFRSGVLDIDQDLRSGISEALRLCEKPRELVAAEVVLLTGRPSFSKAMLDAYTAESRDTHKIPAIYLFALIHVTGAYELLDRVVARIGCRLYVGEAIRDAEMGRLDRQIEALKAKKAALRGGRS